MNNDIHVTVCLSVKEIIDSNHKNVHTQYLFEIYFVPPPLASDIVNRVEILFVFVSNHFQNFILVRRFRLVVPDCSLQNPWCRTVCWTVDGKIYSGLFFEVKLSNFQEIQYYKTCAIFFKGNFMTCASIWNAFSTQHIIKF